MLSIFYISFTWFIYFLLSFVILIRPNFRHVLGDLAAAMPQAVTVTPEEREAIERVSFIFSCICELEKQSNGLFTSFLKFYKFNILVVFSVFPT